jgi:hypothetical protein
VEHAGLRDVGVKHLYYNYNSKSPEMAYGPRQKWIQICSRRVYHHKHVIVFQTNDGVHPECLRPQYISSSGVAEVADKTAIVAENISGSQISHINSHPTLN